MPTLQEITNDEDFLVLPQTDQRIILEQTFTDFNVLPGNDKDIIVSSFTPSVEPEPIVEAPLPADLQPKIAVKALDAPTVAQPDQRDVQSPIDLLDTVITPEFKPALEDPEFLALSDIDKDIILSENVSGYSTLADDNKAKIIASIQPTITPEIETETPIQDTLDVLRGTILPDIREQVATIPGIEPERPSQFGPKEPLQFREEQISPVEAVKDVAKVAGQVGAGFADFAATAVTGTRAVVERFIPAKLAGLSFEESLQEADNLLQDSFKFQELVPEPESETGKQALESINKGLELVFKAPGEKLAELVPDNYPNLKAIVATLTEGITLGTLHVAGVRYRKAKKAIDDAIKEGRDITPEKSELLTGELGEAPIEPLPTEITPDITLEARAPRPPITPESIEALRKKFEGLDKESAKKLEKEGKKVTGKAIFEETKKKEAEAAKRDKVLQEAEDLRTKGEKAAEEQEFLDTILGKREEATKKIVDENIAKKSEADKAIEDLSEADLDKIIENPDFFKELTERKEAISDAKRKRIPEKREEEVEAKEVKKEVKEPEAKEKPKKIADIDIKDIGKREHEGDVVSDKETGKILKEAGKEVKQEGLKPKEQKAFLLDEIDGAIKGAKSQIEGKPFDKGRSEKALKEFKADKKLQESIGFMETNKELGELNSNVIESADYGIIKIEVPGDGTFAIINNKTALQKFRDIAKKKFPGTVADLKPKPKIFKLPSTKRKGILPELIKESEKEVKDIQKEEAAKGRDLLVKPVEAESNLSRFLKDEEGAIGRRETDIDKVNKAIQVDKEISQITKKQENLQTAAKSKRKRKLRNILTATVVDVSGNLKRALTKSNKELSREVIMNHDLIAGASSKAKQIIDAHSDIYKKGRFTDTASSIEALDKHIFSRRVIQIDKNKGTGKVKHPAGTTGVIEQRKLDLIKKNDPELFKKLEDKANKFFNVMKNEVLEPLRKAGLITTELRNRLVKEGDYAPRQFLQHIDPEQTHNFSGQKITVTDSGIKTLGEGSIEALELDSRKMMEQSISRTQGRVFRNEANKSLFKFAENTPNNGIVEILKPVKVTKKGVPVFPQAKAGFEKINVIIDGQKKVMSMPKDMAKEWILRDPKIDSSLAEFVSWISGAKILRAFATGLNPEFALTNFPRDIALILFSQKEFSPHLPVAIPQMAVNLGRIAIDAATRKGAYKDYINEGGGMDFLTHQGHISNRLPGVFNAIQNLMGYIGETSEIWTRLALRDRAIGEGKSPKEATWIARNYLDFSQGGSFVKGADTALPYLNASIQGTRAAFRAIKENPALASYKIAQIGSFAAALQYVNNIYNPETMEDIPNFIKRTSFIITTPIFTTDKEGNKRYGYFRVAKDQGQRIFAAIAEASVDKAMGLDVDVLEVSKAALDAIPLMPGSSMPPIFNAMTGYYANKDFWRNEDIWKGREVKAGEEFLPWTHPAFVKAGKIGISPERLRHATSQFFATNNVFVGAVGGGLKLIMDEIPGQQQREFFDKLQYETPAIRKFLKFTNPATKRRKLKDKLKLESNTFKLKKNRDFYNLLKDVDKTGNRSGVISFIDKEIPTLEKKNYIRRMNNWIKLRDIPNKRFWTDLQDSELTPEVRAVLYWTEFERADSNTKITLEQSRRKVPGMNSLRFRTKLSALKGTPIQGVSPKRKKSIRSTRPRPVRNLRKAFQGR